MDGLGLEDPFRKWSVRRGLHQGARLRSLARAGAETTLHRRQNETSAGSAKAVTSKCAPIIIGARAVLPKPGSWAKFGLEGWLVGAASGSTITSLAAALANKLARIAWSVLDHGRSFARDFEPQSVS